ncbi:apolipoprotein N-acyltransferase [Yonghaparkia sp. Root332]|uniref:apolipoprotein N-acyltransferase n=1 Tax=Yonghaparkia sp. Root332 TaxID=1736516 RepID=UPI0009EA5C08|nr:apolipoprotein N-acyltransferase [Yonghaparkia sp. Root332]
MDAPDGPRAAAPSPSTPPLALAAPAPAGPRLGVAVLVAALGGWTMDLGFPDLGWWPFTILGTALVLWSLRGRSAGGALLVGAVAGFVYYGALIEWLTVYLGIVPWLALTLAQVVFVALGAIPIALAWRWMPVAFPGVAGRLLLLPIVLAGLWTAREGVSNVWPWGGFAWGRLAISQSEGPLAHWAAWAGLSGLSFLVALLAAVLAAVAVERRTPALSRAVLVAGLSATLLVWPAFPTATSGSVRVGAVQGDSQTGLFAQYEPGDILQDHLDATVPLYELDEPLDVVVWPENGSDLDPLRSDYAAAALDSVSSRLDAPVVVGTITAAGEKTFNSVLLWQAGRGAIDQYDKIHPVPFAEYLPEREFFYPLAPDLFDLVPRDYSFGQRDTVLELPDGVVAGVAICYDIVDDDLLARMIDEDATVLLAPTNNADFGRTDQSVQQLAIARLRAIESGRSVVQASTVGASAIIAPDGSTIDDLPLFTAGVMVQEVPLSEVVTPAHALGRALEWFLCLLSAGALLVAGAASRAGRAGRASQRRGEVA